MVRALAARGDHVTATLGKTRKNSSLLIVTLVTLVVSCLAGSLAVALPQAASAATISDNFDRADGGLGSNWTTATGTAAPAIVSNTLRPGTASKLNSAYWSASTFGNDQFAQASLPASSGTQVGPGIAVRLSSTKGYFLWYGNSSGTVSLWRMDSSTSWTQLKQSAALTVSPSSDVWKIQAVGSTISGYQNGKLVVQATDTKITSGSPGVWLYYASNQIDNWSGGDVTAPATYSVGGTVSGLTGTAVLQDNGGNDLSVSANGPFTFSTGLAAGSAYNVTVKTSPSGQTCSVASGTGTIGSANVTNVAVTCAAAATYSVGGTVSGLTGTAVLQDNGGNDLSVSANGPFTFSTGLAAGSAYNVTVKTSPSGQTCSVASGTGTIGSANVTNVAVTCAAAATYSVGGTVSGLTGTAVLQDNGGNDLSVSANGPFTFSTGLAAGSAYNVTVKTSPSGQTCSVASGTGTIGSANVTNVAVTCAAAATYSVGGTVSGLTGTAVLQDNGGNDLSVSANGPFTFSTGLAAGSAYNVTVKTSPSGQTCSVASGTGTIGSANITNVAVTCSSNSAGTATDNFDRADGGLGSNWTTATGTAAPAIVSNTLRPGTASKLNSAYWSASTFGNDQFAQASLPASSGTQVGPGIAVRLSSTKGYFLWYGNSSSTVSLWRMDSSTSWTQLKQSAALTVSPSSDVWKIQAVGSTISGYQNGKLVVQATDTKITSGSPGVWLYYASNQIDNWSGGDVTAPATYSVGGTVSGLTGTAVLQDNGGNDLSVSANGPFTFSTGLAAGSAYNVTVKTSPSGQTCSVASGTGTIGSANVTNVAVTCAAAATYSVGGTVSGLTGTAVLQDNGGNDLSVSANGPFTFSTGLAAGSAYNVTVKTSPSGQTCSVANGTGTIGSANVTNVAVTCTANSASSGSDNFNRADGPLGANWTDMSDGGLAISSQAVAGTNATGTSGDMRTAESYSSNQYSQLEVTSTQLTGSQWIGPAVRTQNGGQNGYLGIYYWNNGNPELMLFMRSGGNWTQLGSTYSTGPLPAGTQLKLMIVGTTLSFLENGVERIIAYDNSFTGGAPGIIANGSAKADNWSAGSAGFEVHYLSTDANGVESYDVISANDSEGPQVLRILRPTSPAAGVAHNFLFALPVEPGLGNSFGDGMATLQAANAQNQYNLTIIEPSFAIDPWYANNATDANLQYETFMTSELVPWVKANLATTGTEQNWLIGFSKSGIGGQDLLLKHPDLFTLAASWDFPADMSSYDQYGASSGGSYGTESNFQANYRLSAAFVDAHKAPFIGSDRIWIGGYNAFQTDMTDYDALLTSEGIAHSTETPTVMAHRWDSGWIPLALAALEQESLNVH